MAENGVNPHVITPGMHPTGVDVGGTSAILNHRSRTNPGSKGGLHFGGGSGSGSGGADELDFGGAAENVMEETKKRHLDVKSPDEIAEAAGASAEVADDSPAMQQAHQRAQNMGHVDMFRNLPSPFDRLPRTSRTDNSRMNNGIAEMMGSMDTVDHPATTGNPATNPSHPLLASLRQRLSTLTPFGGPD
jgi:hypothetical protein